MFLIAWTAAVFALAIALGAQTLGYLSGYTAVIFRCMEIGAQALAPLALSLGLVELIGRSVPARFLMRLAVSATGVVVLVILGTDPLGTTTALTTSWPDPTVFYQLIPLGLIKILAVFTLLIAVVSGLVALARSGRGGESGALVGPALTAAAASALVAVPGLMMLAHVGMHSSVFALTGLLAAMLTWLAAATAGRRGLADDRLADDREPRRQYTDSRWYEPDDESDYLPGRLDDYPGAANQDEDRYRDPRSEPAAHGFSDADDDLSYPALAALAAERPDPAEGFREPVSRSRFEPDDRRGPPDNALDASDQLFGQITIYTLLDDRLEEFDRITEEVVQRVRSREPGTLVYIVHAVPTAPMQRILYEVYRDRAAYDEHLARPYVSRYVDERRSMVLATNAIELGLQQAKVSPLPSYSAISDILSESGIDLTGVTRSAPGAASAQSGQRRRSEPPDPHQDRRGDPRVDPLRGPHQDRRGDPLRDPHQDRRGDPLRDPHHDRREDPLRDLPLDPRRDPLRAPPLDEPPGPGRYESAQQDGDEPSYDDWGGYRDEDPWYR
jgi:quinol monooxygenase YgiN